MIEKTYTKEEFITNTASRDIFDKKLLLNIFLITEMCTILNIENSQTPTLVDRENIFKLSSKLLGDMAIFSNTETEERIKIIGK